MSAVIVIPARHASSRLPGKPLLRQTGKYLIQHVYERARLCQLARAVVVATDDARIYDAVASFGGLVVMTRDDHPSGTDRVAEVARQYDDAIVVNLQGDEPLIEPDDLDLVVRLLQDDPAAEMATLAIPLHSAAQYHDPACVKAVLDEAGNALYFSRAPVPFHRDGEPDFTARPARIFQHVGLYAYRRDFLLRYAATPPSALERIEKLEQLRALAMGARIKVGQIDQPTFGVDTEADYRQFVAMYQRTQAA